MTFAEILRKQMDKRELTQYSLSKCTKIAQPTISRWLSGDFLPSIDKVFAICDGLGISISEFFSEISAEDNDELLPNNLIQSTSGDSINLIKRRRKLHQALDLLLDEYELQKPD